MDGVKTEIRSYGWIRHGNMKPDYCPGNLLDWVFWPICQGSRRHSESAGCGACCGETLYNYFQYDLAVFSLPADSGGLTAFSPLDAAGCRSSFLMARESFHELKSREINGYRHLGLATPVQARFPAIAQRSCGNRGQWELRLRSTAARRPKERPPTIF